MDILLLLFMGKRMLSGLPSTVEAILDVLEWLSIGVGVVNYARRPAGYCPIGRYRD